MKDIQFRDAFGIHNEVRFFAASSELHQQVRATGEQARRRMVRQQPDRLAHRHRRSVIKPFHNENLPWMIRSETNYQPITKRARASRRRVR